MCCFNREREWIIGRNAKGQFPRLSRPVFAAEVLIDGKRFRLDRVTSIAEAALFALMAHPGAFVTPLGRA